MEISNFSIEGRQKNNANQEKILLALLPFWTPLIPPMGISCLKSFLQHHDYEVKIIDLNIVEKFRKIYDKYFSTLKGLLPEGKRGNFYNTGHDVLQNHMMAHFNHKNEDQYIQLVKQLVYKNYLCELDNRYIREMGKIIKEFYIALEEYFLDLLVREKPAVLGLSVYRGTLPASLFACKLTREKYPRIKTVMGGGIFSQELSMGSRNFKFFLEKIPYIDKIIVGEGENLFLKYLQDELPPGKKVYSPEDTDKQFIDFNSLETPDFSGLDIGNYTYLAAYASRSCPFQCSFCAETVYWGKYRKKRTAQIIRELKTLFKKYNRQLFLMCDSLLNPIITNLAEELNEEDISLYWDGYLRVDKDICDIEKIRLWRQGGFYRTRLGIESWSPAVLEMMGNKIKVRQIKKTVSSLAEAGIKTTTYWVIGHPGETEEDFQKTLHLIAELSDDIYEAECNSFRFFETGQVNSGKWVEKHKIIPVYPVNSRDLLITQTWTLDCEPSREVTIERIWRFVEHCNHLGIPNPYALPDIYRADERWEMLHKNAVPGLLRLNDSNSCVYERKKLKEFLSGPNKFREDGDFGF